MAKKSAAQFLLGSMKDVLEGVLGILQDPDAKAGAGLNPDANPDSTTAQAAVDRIGIYFNSDNPDGQQYLETVDDIITLVDALRDIIAAVRFSGDATPVEDYLSLLLNVVGLTVVRRRIPTVYYAGRVLGFIQDVGGIQATHRFVGDMVKELTSGTPVLEYFGKVYEDLPDQVKVDAILGVAAGLLMGSLYAFPSLRRAIDMRVFYGWDSLPNVATPVDTLLERSLSVTFRKNAREGSPTCADIDPDAEGLGLLLNVTWVTEESGSSSKGVLVSAILEETWIRDLRYGTPEQLRGRLTLRVTGPFELHFFAGRTIESLSTIQPPTLLVEFEPLPNSDDEPMVIVGSKGGTRLEIGRFTVTGEVRPLVDSASYGIKVKAQDGAIIIKPDDGDGFFQKIFRGLTTGGELKITFELGVGVRTGLGFFIEGGAGMRVTLAIGKQLGPLRLQTLVLGLNAGTDDAGKLTLDAEVGAGLSFHVPGVDIIVDQVGLTWKLKPFGGMGFKPPKGLGIQIDFVVVKGGGYLFFDPENRMYAGAVYLKFGPIAISGVGLVQTFTKADGTEDYAFVIILSVEVMIQLGFGFLLVGLGGLFGQNRGVAPEELQEGIRGGVLDSILFPVNPVANAPRIIAALSAVFPVQEGQTIFGPMLKLGWGGVRSFIEVALGLIIEFESPNRLIMLGKATADFPTKENPIVHLELDCVGIFNPSTGESSIDATLYRSKLGPYTIAGDIVWRSVGGTEPFWILAIGGIHPDFHPPAGILPPMQRISITLTEDDNPRVVLSGYGALTSNTIQVGGAVDASYSKAGFTLSAHLGADAMINTATFEFVVGFDVSVSIKRGSTRIASIGFEGTVKGPKPLRFDGRAYLDLWLVEVSFHVHFTVGKDKPGALASLSVSIPLLEAYNDSRNWSGMPPDTEQVGVTLVRSGPLTTDPAVDFVVHPLGKLAVRQRVAPMDLEIEKFSAGAVAGDNRFTIDTITLGGETATESAALTDFFPVGDFLALSDREKLSRPSFELLQSGISFASDAVRSGEKLDALLAYKTVVRKKASRPVLLNNRYTPSVEKFLVAVKQGAAAVSVLRNTGALRFAGPANRFAVAEPTFTVALKANLQTPGGLPNAVRQGTTYSQAAQALRAFAPGASRRSLQIVSISEVQQP
jgi:hypothetical protein